MSTKLTKGNYELVSSLLTIGMAALAKKAVDMSFKVSKGKKPPKNPDANNVTLGEVILYTAATAAVGVATKILIRKLLVSQWKKHEGELPEGLN